MTKYRMGPHICLSSRLYAHRHDSLLDLRQVPLGYYVRDADPPSRNYLVLLAAVPMRVLVLADGVSDKLLAVRSRPGSNLHDRGDEHGTNARPVHHQYGALKPVKLARVLSPVSSFFLCPCSYSLSALSPMYRHV